MHVDFRAYPGQWKRADGFSCKLRNGMWSTTREEGWHTATRPSTIAHSHSPSSPISMEMARWQPPELGEVSGGFPPDAASFGNDVDLLDLSEVEQQLLARVAALEAGACTLKQEVDWEAQAQASPETRGAVIMELSRLHQEALLIKKDADRVMSDLQTEAGHSTPGLHEHSQPLLGGDGLKTLILRADSNHSVALAPWDSRPASRDALTSMGGERRGDGFRGAERSRRAFMRR